MGSHVPVLGRTFLPRKGLKRKSRRKAEGFLRNWSGKPGFFGLCPKKCALDRLGKSKCSNPAKWLADIFNTGV
jgi:hypothetical protein